jgi:hypothetical protein
MAVSFLDIILENPFLPVYFITVALALWRYPRYFETPLRYFPVLLMYTLVTEIWGVLIKYYDHFDLFLDDFFQNYNWLIYNIYNIVFYLYFYYVFWYYLRKKGQKLVIAFGTAFLIIISIINAYWHNFLLESQFYAYIAGALLLITAVLFYFTQQASEHQQWFHRDELLSWVSVGLLLFYLGYLPIKVIRYYNALYVINDSPFIRRIHLFLILLMYGCFIVGFLRMGRSNRNIVRPLK